MNTSIEQRLSQGTPWKMCSSNYSSRAFTGLERATGDGAHAPSGVEFPGNCSPWVTAAVRSMLSGYGTAGDMGR